MVRPINKRVEKVFLFYEKGSAASLEAAWKKHGRPTSLGNVQRQYHKYLGKLSQRSDSPLHTTSKRVADDFHNVPVQPEAPF